MRRITLRTVTYKLRLNRYRHERVKDIRRALCRRRTQLGTAPTFGANDETRGVQSDRHRAGYAGGCSDGRGRALRFGWTQTIRKVSGYAKETMGETIQDYGVGSSRRDAAAVCGGSACIGSAGEYVGGGRHFPGGIRQLPGIPEDARGSNVCRKRDRHFGGRLFRRRDDGNHNGRKLSGQRGNGADHSGRGVCGICVFSGYSGLLQLGTAVLSIGRQRSINFA